MFSDIPRVVDRFAVCQQPYNTVCVGEVVVLHLYIRKLSLKRLDFAWYLLTGPRMPVFWLQMCSLPYAIPKLTLCGRTDSGLYSHHLEPANLLDFSRGSRGKRMWLVIFLHVRKQQPRSYYILVFMVQRNSGKSIFSQMFWFESVLGTGQFPILKLLSTQACHLVAVGRVHFFYSTLYPCL